MGKEERMRGGNIGIDGCKCGWIGVFRDQTGGGPQAVLLNHLNAVDAPLFRCIAIDIPIGLPDLGSRHCDKEARRLLGQVRGCSVFPAPLRSLLEAPTYRAACDCRHAAEGKMISLQTWNIIPKIAEVDRLLRGREDLRSKVFEVHPEVSFSEMNRGTPLLTKKSKAAGREERSRLVDCYFGAGTFRGLRDSLLPRKGWGDDDLLDACAALWTAERIAAGTARSLPAAIHSDSAGLPMRIVY